MNPFFISILACLILKEKIRAIEIIGIVVCFIGVIMIGFGKQKRIDEKEAENSEDGSQFIEKDSKSLNRIMAFVCDNPPVSGEKQGQLAKTHSAFNVCKAKLWKDMMRFGCNSV